MRLQNSKEVTGLLEDIYANKVGVRTPITVGKEASIDNGGLGNTFVEIDLKGQHMWYHKDGQIILESYIVSELIMILIEGHQQVLIIFIIRNEIVF